MKNFLAALLLLFGCSVSAQASDLWVTFVPDDAFTFDGKPIDPRCVMQFSPALGRAPSDIDLTQCSIDLAGMGPVSKKDGYFFETSEEASDWPGARGYDSYKVLARSNSRFVVATEWSGGGSGHFSDLMIVRRDGNKLLLEKSLSRGGDRCNGGLADNSVVGSKLYWSLNITPYDVLRLAGNKSLTAYEDLESSAQSCVGTEDMEYDLDAGTSEFVSVTFDTSYFGRGSQLLEDRRGWTDHYTDQRCFNKLYNNYVSSGRSKLAPKQLQMFAQEFMNMCVGAH